MECKRTINPTTAIIIFIIILIIAIATSLICTPASFDQYRWHVFLITLAALSIVITFMFYYSLVELQVSQDELTSIQEDQRIVDKVRNITGKSIPKYAPIVPEFVKELMPLRISSCKSLKNGSENKCSDIEIVASRNALSYEIFTVWESSIIDKHFISIDKSYINLYLQWATSRCLREDWRKMKINVNEDAVIFGDLLFKYAPRKGRNRSRAYNKASSRLMEDCRFKELFI